MAKKKTRTPLQQEYYKERKRVQNLARRLEKRGYLLPEDLVPNIPKRITAASIRRLKKLSPDIVYQKAKYVDTETGEVISGTAGRKAERQRSAQKAKATREANKRSATQFFTGGTLPTDQIPDDWIADDVGTTTYDDVVGDLIARLQQDAPEMIQSFYSGKKFRRNRNLMEEVNRAKQEIIDRLQQETSQAGKEAMGWRIINNSDEIDSALSTLNYASSSEHVYMALMVILRILNVSVPQSVISAVSESMEDHEEAE